MAEKYRVPDYSMPLFQQLMASEDRQLAQLGAQLGGIIEAIQGERESIRSADTKRRIGFARSEAGRLMPGAATTVLGGGALPQPSAVEAAQQEEIQRAMRERIAQELPPEQAAEAYDILFNEGKSFTTERDLITVAGDLAMQYNLINEDKERPTTIGAAKSLIDMLAALAVETESGVPGKGIDERILLAQEAMQDLLGNEGYKVYRGLKMTQQRRDKYERGLAIYKANMNYRNTREFNLAKLNITRGLAALGITARRRERLMRQVDAIQEMRDGKSAIDNAIRAQLEPERLPMLNELERRAYDALEELDAEEQRIIEGMGTELGDFGTRGITVPPTLYKTRRGQSRGRIPEDVRHGEGGGGSTRVRGGKDISREDVTGAFKRE